MNIARFLQIHTLHSYPAALLNRDASGLAKRMPFGDAVRTRISSQCLKRHWRDPQDKKQHEYALHRIPNAVTAVRTRNVIGRQIMQALVNGGEIDEEVLNAVEEEFVKGVYGPKATPGEDSKSESSRQPLLLGLPEVEYLREKAAAICQEHSSDAKSAGDAAKEFFDNSRNNFAAMRQQLNVELPAGQHGGLEGALFGRMVTSDPGANIEAAVHVAHAFTVHREESESDYFSVVDDLQDEDEDPGAAHIGDMELTAGLFYGYVVVDVPGLVSNLVGCPPDDWQNADKSLAGQVVHNLIHLIATVSPGAKLGSTAPYAYADLMLIEAGNRQPRSLANAFRIPVKAQVESAAEALAAEMNGLDNMYGAKEARRISSKKNYNIPNAEHLCLDDLATWAANAVRSGEAG